MKDRQDLLETVIFKTEFIFVDIYNNMLPEHRARIDEMDDDELEKFLELHIRSMSKSMENGVMLDWDVTAAAVGESIFEDE